jgi:hypothetical protein
MIYAKQTFGVLLTIYPAAMGFTFSFTQAAVSNIRQVSLIPPVPIPAGPMTHSDLEADNLIRPMTL